MLGYVGVDLIARRGEQWYDDSRAVGRRNAEQIGDEPRINTYGANGDGLSRDGLGADNGYGLVMGPGQYRLNRDGLRLDQSDPNKKYSRDYSQPKT